MVVIQLNLEKIVLHAQSVSSVSPLCEELQNEWKELFKLRLQLWKRTCGGGVKVWLTVGDTPGHGNDISITDLRVRCCCAPGRLWAWLASHRCCIYESDTQRGQ